MTKKFLTPPSLPDINPHRVHDILFTPIRLNELEILIENSVSKALREHQSSGISNPEPQSEHKMLYSIRALGYFIGCSSVTAQKLKNEGRIPYRQIGRKVIFDTVEVLKAMEQPKNKKK